MTISVVGGSISGARKIFTIVSFFAGNEMRYGLSEYISFIADYLRNSRIGKTLSAAYTTSTTEKQFGSQTCSLTTRARCFRKL